MTLWGYARVSTVDQDTTAQFDALRRAGVDEAHIVTDHASGSRGDRPGLAGLLDELKPGDVLTVWKLNRLGRSVSHLVSVVDDLGRRGVQFRSLTEALDSTTATGRLLFHIMASVAEFERELTRERTRTALETARQSGKPLGRPSRVNPRQYRHIMAAHEAGETQSAIAAATGLSRAVVGRVLRGEIASLAQRHAPPTSEATVSRGVGADVSDTVAAAELMKREEEVPVAETPDKTPAAPAKAPRARPRWHVVELQAAEAGDPDATVVVMSTHSSQTAARNTLSRLRSRHRSNSDVALEVRASKEIRRRLEWDPEKGRGVTRIGPPTF